MIYNTLNIYRTFNFVKRLLMYNKSALLAALGIAGGILCIISTFNMIMRHGISNYQLINNSFYVIIPTGLILTSIVLSEMGLPQRAYSLLTLPVSNIEKLAGAWFVCSLCYIGATILLLFIVSLLFGSLANVIYGSPVILLNPFESNVLKYSAEFLVLQTLFMAGGVIFSKNAFLKTLLMLIAIFLVLQWSYILLTKLGISPSTMKPYEEGSAILKDPLYYVFKIFYWAILGPLVLSFTYFKLKEKEV